MADNMANRSGKGPDLYVGIDLGTTNSVIASISKLPDGRLQTPIIKVDRKTRLRSRGTFQSEKKELLPSAVAYREDEKGGCDIIVGDFARTMARTRPYAVALSVKSQMGQARLEIPGFKETYPDSTPEQVSARILQHLKKAVESQYYLDVKEAVITIPACFNAAQCEATLKAAQLAGFNVLDKMGHYREDILLSEPEAVIYDVVNQLQNGQLYFPMDFESPKNVMVFDIGGGTLDITLHTIGRNKANPQMFDVQPVAINRYSSIAGDTFDSLLAKELFARYLKQQAGSDLLVAREAMKQEDRLLPYMVSYAEELKICISERYQEQKELGRLLPQEAQLDYGGELPNGYSCEDSMSVGDFEQCLLPLLGKDYTVDDYKNFDNLTDDRNIIYPVLDVLHKAAAKLGEEVRVDGIIMNGGMSRLYLIENRLEEFFGLKPIKVSDPDKSVAQGAAVYHYYMKHSKASEVKHQTFMEELRDKQPAGNGGAFGNLTSSENVTSSGKLSGTGRFRAVS